MKRRWGWLAGWALLSGCYENSPVVLPGNVFDPNAAFARDSIPDRVDSLGISLVDAADSNRIIPLWTGRPPDLDRLPLHVGGDGEEFLLVVRGYAPGRTLCYRETFRGNQSISRMDTCAAVPPWSPGGLHIRFQADSAVDAIAVSVHDSLHFSARVSSEGKGTLRCYWDHNGDGKYDGIPELLPSDGLCKSDWAYPVAGDFPTLLKLVDAEGHQRIDTLEVNVLVDPPVADAGRDTMVAPNTFFSMRGTGSDRFGKIVWSSWTGPLVKSLPPDPNTSVFRAPAEEGAYPMIFQVRDDDFNTTNDTVVVNVSAKAYAGLDLEYLAGSEGKLIPPFSPSITNYEFVVPNAVGRITLSAAAGRDGSTLSLDGVKAPGHGVLKTFDLAVGRKPVRISVTDAEGAVRNYDVDLIREEHSRMGYALVGNDSGTLSIASGYNSHGAAPSAYRLDPGKFRVTFPGLGEGADSLVNVQVTPYGAVQSVCGIVAYGGGDFTIDVFCATPQGVALETGFSVTANWARRAYTGRNAFGILQLFTSKDDEPPLEASVLPAPYLRPYNSHSDSGTAIYNLYNGAFGWEFYGFASEGYSGPLNVSASKIGDVPGFCKAEVNPYSYDSRHGPFKPVPSGPPKYAITAKTAAFQGNTDEERFLPISLSLSLSLLGPLESGTDFDLAFATVKQSSNDSWPSYYDIFDEFNSTGGSVQGRTVDTMVFSDTLQFVLFKRTQDGPGDTLRVSRPKLGEYLMIFEGMGSPDGGSRRGTALVTPGMFDSGTCQIASVESEKDLRIRVKCMDQSGDPTYVPFSIRAYR